MHRRHFFKLAAGSVLGSGVAATLNSVDSYATTRVIGKRLQLLAKEGSTQLAPDGYPATAVWAYNDTVPGTEIRLEKGEPLSVVVDNQLPESTTVHWHGLRIPNAMDGVAGLTQEAIKPGEKFHYEFTPPDSGTYWYHSHLNTPTQVGRGLYGALIIEDENPPFADRELVWLIDDWRMNQQASLVDDFGNFHDNSHAGRIGNVVTINGKLGGAERVRSGERIRLRIVNCANARIFGLEFAELQPWIIAWDGQPVEPVKLTGPLVVPTAGRVDLMLDMTGAPGSQSQVVDRYYRQAFELLRFDYSEEEPVRENTPDDTMLIGQVELPEPDPGNATVQPVTMAGGAMGGMRGAMMQGKWLDIQALASSGFVWAINEESGETMKKEMLLEVPRGTTVKYVFENQSSWDHPMHQHGHHMKVLSIDGEPVKHAEWRDTILVRPRQKIEAAFVADNPGKWLLHCHVLEHHATGMGAVISVV